MHIIQLVTLPSEKQQKEQTKNHMQERGRCKVIEGVISVMMWALM
jgi:hypothetical protein